MQQAKRAHLIEPSASFPSVSASASANRNRRPTATNMTSPQYNPSTGPTAGQHSSGPQNYYGSADENSYTRPPPSYADADEALLRGGGTRNSEDNVRVPPLQLDTLADSGRFPMTSSTVA